MSKDPSELVTSVFGTGVTDTVVRVRHGTTDEWSLSKRIFGPLWILTVHSDVTKKLVVSCMVPSEETSYTRTTIRTEKEINFL